MYFSDNADDTYFSHSCTRIILYHVPNRRDDPMNKVLNNLPLHYPRLRKDQVHQRGDINAKHLDRQPPVQIVPRLQQVHWLCLFNRVHWSILSLTAPAQWLNGGQRHEPVRRELDNRSMNNKIIKLKILLNRCTAEIKRARAEVAPRLRYGSNETIAASLYRPGRLPNVTFCRTDKAIKNLYL